VLDHLESNRHGVWGKAEQNGALCPMPSRAHARSCNVREQMERRVGRRWPRQRIAASRHSGLGCMSPAEGVHDHAGEASSRSSVVSCPFVFRLARTTVHKRLDLITDTRRASVPRYNVLGVVH